MLSAEISTLFRQAAGQCHHYGPLRGRITQLSRVHLGKINASRAGNDGMPATIA